MSEINKIKINSSCILTVPLQSYEKDFSFIVNGEEFKTSRLIADLLSPVICHIHLNDPTFDRFIINTSHRGDFSRILQLFNFEPKTILENEVSFYEEIFEILGNESIEYGESKDKEEFSIDNIMKHIEHHEKYSNLYKELLPKEIEFISKHFYELFEKEEEFAKLSIDTLTRIFENRSLRMKSEDDLLGLINNLYKRDDKYSILYELVLFENVNEESMKEFIGIFDINHINIGTWHRLVKRLESKIENKTPKENKNEYERYQIKKTQSESKNKGGKEFEGIINYLREQSNDYIENEINITASSIGHNAENRQPRVVTVFEDQNNYFYTKNELNSWLCFDFIERRIIPTEYTIRSYPYDPNLHHLKSWIIECSNDNNSWEPIDEEKDCSELNGKNNIHTFKMKHQTSKEFRYIRIRLTGPNWYNYNYLILNYFEIYGTLK